MTTPSSLLTSPDPLTLPSSPLAARSTRSTRQQSSTKPRVQRSYSSPSKSFVLDTGVGAAGEASPWRIKVTVEAEPNGGSGSPSAKRGQERRAKERSLNLISMADESDSPDVVQPRQPLRKRKATPIRDRERRTTTRVREQARDSATPDDAELMPPPPLPATSSASKAKRRGSLKAFEVSRPTQRSKRLSRAREELGLALREAVGGGGEYLDGEEEEDVDAGGDGEDGSEERYRGHEEGYGEGDDNMAGDMTVAGDEDFTMVSVETLQSMRGDHSLVSHRGEGDVSAASVSYWPSSPPKQDVEEMERVAAGVQYPDLPNETGQAKQGADYDAMSWRATTLPKQTILHKQTSDQRLDSEPSEWRRAREVVSRRIQEANTSQVIVIEDDTVAEAAEPEDEDRVEGSDAADADDIWQEEASRSVEEESEVEARMAEDATHRPSRRTTRRAAPTIGVTLTTGCITTTTIAAPSVNHDLLADQPIRPRRSKIPRTWRRSSGVDFAYSDSPAHIEPAPLDIRKRDHSTDGGGSRASSGVLTPPSSGDEGAQRNHHQEEGQGQDDEMSEADFTRPDAEATMLHHDTHTRAKPANDDKTAASASDDSASSTTSMDGEETGMFWQSNLPAVYSRQRGSERPRLQRPGQQKRAMDLTELLGLDGSSSPAKQRVHTSIRNSQTTVQPAMPQPRARQSVLQTGPIDGTSHHSGGSGGKMMSSPLRRSLLSSSRIIGGSSLGEGAGQGTHVRGDGSSSSEVSRRAARESNKMVEVSVQEEDMGESFASKASHQRQLLTEMVGATRFTRLEAQMEAQMEVEAGDETAWSAEVTEGIVDSAAGEEYISEEEEEEEMTEEPSRSYEEHLNVESPQKIKVKFGDSLDSSLLVPKRAYAPLFGSTKATQQQQSASATTKQTSTTTTTSATTATHSSLSQQRDSFPQTILSLITTSIWSAITRPPPPPPLPYPCVLRANLRSRYGVLTMQHPWTMAHMRTLHRMHNSCSSGKADTIIPRPGTASPEIPGYLVALVGKKLTSSSGSHDWVFTAENAQVVLAFLQVLVPEETIAAMENGEVEVLGDETAAEHRTTLAGRRAEDMVWGDKIGVLGRREVIEWGFVVKAVGDCLGANIRTAAREAKEAKEAAEKAAR
ncbi:hypothetical protein LTR48_003624 [Friedmanniomyces endolithicus]|uniref:Uncharacterized protein n=1 Tax=Rachicladosporium monterosium TaxID=1507873 RepID=A0ABR0L7B7_9PEZI|nr:hypothetical protein LTR48_003624 [Friedmanniomyces endolithicus]KAK5144600.1 hypothetical protein LTR32_003513 [Rachicladosporium monterosium]